jgi:hypothetical protein
VTSNFPDLVEIKSLLGLLYSQRTAIGSYLELTKCWPCSFRQVTHLDSFEILPSQIRPDRPVGYFRGNVKHCIYNDDDDDDNGGGGDGDDEDDDDGGGDDDDDDNNNNNNIYCNKISMKNVALYLAPNYPDYPRSLPAKRSLYHPFLWQPRSTNAPYSYFVHLPSTLHNLSKWQRR